MKLTKRKEPIGRLRALDDMGEESPFVENFFDFQTELPRSTREHLEGIEIHPFKPGRSLMDPVYILEMMGKNVTIDQESVEKLVTQMIKSEGDLHLDEGDIFESYASGWIGGVEIEFEASTFLPQMDVSLSAYIEEMREALAPENFPSTPLHVDQLGIIFFAYRLFPGRRDAYAMIAKRNLEFHLKDSLRWKDRDMDTFYGFLNDLWKFRLMVPSSLKRLRDFVRPYKKEVLKLDDQDLKRELELGPILNLFLLSAEHVELSPSGKIIFKDPIKIQSQRPLPGRLTI